MQRLPHFRVDFKDFMRGSNSFKEYPDGGFLPTTKGQNIYNSPGLLTSKPDYTDNVASLDLGEPTNAWGVGPSSAGLGATAVALGCALTGGSDGLYYTVSDTGVYTQVGSADSSQDYNGPGFVDALQYAGSWYFTSRTNVIQTSINLVTKDLTWWTTTKGKSSLDSFSPHPMVVYGNIMYVADKNYLHQNDNGTVTTQVFDLPAGWVITAMTVWNNLIYMAAEPYWNASSQYHGQAKIFTWDGYSDSWLSEYNIDTRICAFFVFENILFCFTSTYLGYFDGAKVRYVRPLGSAVYKNMIAQVDDSMFYIDTVSGDSVIVRYGSPIPGTRKVFNNYLPIVTNRSWKAILGFKDKNLIMAGPGQSGSYNTSYYISDINAAGTSNAYCHFNPRTFSQPVKVRYAIVEIDGVLGTNQYVEVNYYDDSGSVKNVGNFSNGTSEMSGKGSWRFDVLGNKSTRTVEPYLLINRDTKFKYVDFFYEPSEWPMNK